MERDGETPVVAAAEGDEESATKSSRLRITELLRGPFDIRSLALTGVFVLALFYTIYFMRAVLLPLVLALLLSYLLRPIVRGLVRAHISPLIGAALILLGLIGTIGCGVYSLATPAAAWIASAPSSLERVQWKLMPLKKPIQNVAKASGEIEKLTAPDNAPAKTTVEVKQHPINDILFVQTPELVVGTVTMLILLYFLLVYDGVFLMKLIRLMPTLSDKKRAVSIAHDIESHVSRYLLTITVINICLGTAVGTTVGLLGLHNPIMWGVMVAVLNFIPYLGALTGIICMTLGAVLSFDSFSYALIFPAAYLILASLEGNFITPMVMGKSLTLNPVIVLLSLIFWGWMWGIAGIILAVPILAAFKIFCAHIEPMEPLAEFLS